METVSRPARHCTQRLVVGIAITGFTSFACAADIFASGLEPCDTVICGGFSQNVAQYDAKGGVFIDSANGGALIQVLGLRDKQTGRIADHVRFDVAEGTFGSQFWQGHPIGHFMTNRWGDGALRIRFAPGSEHAMNFVLDTRAGAQFISGFHVRGQGRSPALAAGLLPCDKAICGNFDQNVATLTVERTHVGVTTAGGVTMTLDGLRSDGQPASDMTLYVNQGIFTDMGWAGVLVGHIVTDDAGNFSGPVQATGGGDLVLAPGTYTGNFVINDSDRSQFISGIAVASRRDRGDAKD